MPRPNPQFITLCPISKYRIVFAKLPIAFSVSAMILMTGATSALAVDYAECRKIVAMHSFMMEARKACRIKLAKDTSDLAYQCVSALSEAHRNIAIWYGREEVWKPLVVKKGTKAACQSVKDDWSPLIAD